MPNSKMPFNRSTSHDFHQYHHHSREMTRMSNTAEILIKQFTMHRNNISDLEGSDTWPWKRLKDEFVNFFVPKSSHDEVSELFPKYRTRLQNNFFVR